MALDNAYAQIPGAAIQAAPVPRPAPSPVQTRSSLLPPKDVLSLIPEFNGDTKLLSLFIRKCEFVIQKFQGASDRNEFLMQYITSKLTGKAAELISERGDIDETWLQLKELLIQHFGDPRSEECVAIELETLKIKNNETYLDFCSRIQDVRAILLSKVNQGSSKQIIEAKKIIYNNTSLNIFLYNLPEHIVRLIRLKNPQTLEDALSHVLEEVNFQEQYNLRSKMLQHRSQPPPQQLLFRSTPPQPFRNPMADHTKQIDAPEPDESNVNEEYAYLDRGGFSSEKFKIELRGLPKFYGIAELKKLMNHKLGLNTSKIKRPKNGSHWLYACFQNDEERTKAITALNGYAWKGKTLIAEIAKPAPDPLVRKRKQEETTVQDKKMKVEDNKSQEERLMDATTPYWRMPYDDQLKLKENDIKQILMRFDNEIWKIAKERRSFIETNRKLYNGLSFEVLPIKGSPVKEGYRNKCEFTVGIDEETKLTTVGFRLGSYVTGTVGVAPIQSLVHISEATKKAVLLFQEFVRNSELAPFSPADYSGYWRYLTVRHSSSTGDIMLIVFMHPQNLTEEELTKVKEDLVNHFSSDVAIACGIKSLYFELVTKKRVGEDSSKPIHLSGSTHIIDTILERQFRISPEAFFQVNTAGADILYQSAIDLSQVKEDSTVVDICCGTGTIGLCFAKHCSKVLGLELINEAVKDAKANAELNKIENCDFFTGKAEDILPSVLARATGEDIIAIVDPPRAGLHMRAITQLRNTKKVKRLVYISCSPSSAVKNFIDLARPSSKTLRGAPFLPVRALPVDMFPHTKHVELAILFEREAVQTDKTGSEEASMEAGSEVTAQNMDNEFAEDIIINDDIS